MHVPQLPQKSVRGPGGWGAHDPLLMETQGLALDRHAVQNDHRDCVLQVTLKMGTVAKPFLEGCGKDETNTVKCLGQCLASRKH